MNMICKFSMQNRKVIGTLVCISIILVRFDFSRPPQKVLCMDYIQMKSYAKPACIFLHTTRSNISCSIALNQTSPTAGIIVFDGNCNGFIGTVALNNKKNGTTQLAHIIPPNRLFWPYDMGAIDNALITVYKNVLHSELLNSAHWVENSDVSYSPTIQFFEINAVTNLNMAINLPTYNDTQCSHEENCAMDKLSGINFSNFSNTWTGEKFGNLSSEFDLTGMSKYDKIWLMGTSESRKLFDHICYALQEREVPHEKHTSLSRCQHINFVSTCTLKGCGCDFIPKLLELEKNLSNHFISVSCGLHEEYLEGEDYWRTQFDNLNKWALALEKNNTVIQFRTINAVNSFKTKPEKLIIPRNNVRARMFRDIALSTLVPNLVPVLDVFEMTEAIFYTSDDHVHLQSWSYREIAKMFFLSLNHGGFYYS